VDTRLESLRFLVSHLPLDRAITLGLVRTGWLNGTTLTVPGGFSFRVDRTHFGRVYDILHIIDDGWNILPENNTKVTLVSEEGVATLTIRAFLDSPWLGVLLASGWTVAAGRLSKRGLSFSCTDDLYVLHETFDRDAYKPTQCVEGKRVVDVGASFGDTCIYFASQGATVVGFEPSPVVYERALENIRYNGFETRITLVNAAIHSGIGPVILLPTKGDVSQSSGLSLWKLPQYRPDSIEHSKPIPVTTLSRAIGSKGGDLLKLDCEGAEYDIILNDYDEVRQFNELIVEWHQSITGLPVSRLTKVLARDFDVSIKFGMAGVAGRAASYQSKSDVGMIRAVRKK
jgi:FkbM family methyltransferase